MSPPCHHRVTKTYRSAPTDMSQTLRESAWSGSLRSSHTSCVLAAEASFAALTTWSTSSADDELHYQRGACAPFRSGPECRSTMEGLGLRGTMNHWPIARTRAPVGAVAHRSSHNK